MTRDALSMAQARDAYFAENQFGVDGGYSATWVKVKVGPVPLWIPNAPARVRAVRFHDLHHIVTDYRTDFPGECEISAWELATGCAHFPAALVLNLSGMGGGLLFMPGAVFRAFVRGRHTQNLYRRTFDETLLGKTVKQLRRELNLDAPTPKPTPADLAAFVAFAALAALTALCAAAVFLAPPALIAAGLWKLLHG